MTPTLGCIAASCYRMLAVLSALLLVAARGTNVPNLPPGPNAPLVPQSYLIQPGDTLGVKVVKNPELNEQPTVAPDGRISMLFAPNLEVASKLTEAARGPVEDRAGAPDGRQPEAGLSDELRRGRVRGEAER